ncbi:MAG: endonuclease III [Eubacteriales bacterium]|nr:endonuclease III [Clostridium sp.]MDD7503733.1 endonuclease III [Clostridium sp.]MDY5001079.1 endonuclease III [Eubacteriales bacterium]MDY6088459.1 endonuclease III [Eubacteriales bacterium]
MNNKKMSREEWDREVLRILSETYPDAKPELDFSNPFELLIATILSAQCTDKQVNKCTPALFRDHPNAASMAEMTPDELSVYIKPCGFFNTKAKNIIAACKELAEKYGGEVPADRDALEALPGVGRKTANVVLSNAFGVPAIAVDTHVFRVSNRLGLAEAKTVEQTEIQLMQHIPMDSWSIAHHYLIFHGRRICSAKKPNCECCTLRELCKTYNERA